MCGIVGVAGFIAQPETKVFRDMLQLDVVRGPHSTGVATVSPTDGSYWAKAAMLPQDFFDTRHYKNAMTGVKTLLMGHNRFATVGKIATATAHPFEFEHILGMHNGTLRNWRTVLDNAKDFTVDSECLLAHMNDNGLDVFEKLEGAYALTWYDERDRTLNMLRNDQRPLVTRMSKDQRTMFYASEGWMINAAAWRNNVQLADPVYDVTPGKHFKWELPKTGAAPLGKPSLRKVNTYTPPPPADYYDGRGNGYGKQGNITRIPDVNKPLRDRVSKQQNFYAIGFKETNPQTGYGELECLICDRTNTQIMVRCNREEAKELEDWDGYLSGKPSSFVGQTWDYKASSYKEGYLVIPYSFVEKHEEPEELVVVAPKGPRGNDLTEKEFDKLTKDGCAYCSGNILYGEPVHWWNNEPFCQDCENEFFDTAKQTANVARTH